MWCVAVSRRGGASRADGALRAGTGNYIAFLHPLVRRVVGLDANDGMLRVASTKFAGASNVTVVKGSALSPPLPRASFDVVMLNQVVHHLETADTRSEGRFEALHQVLRVALDLLRPGGVLLLNHQT